MKKLRGLAIVVVLLIVSMVFTACSSSVNNENSQGSSDNTIRVGAIKALGTVTPYVAKEKGYFEKAGLNVEIKDFSDGTVLAEAYAAGELDFALMGIAPTATWYSKGVDLQVIAGANGGGHAVLVRADSGINTVQDLKGKIIAEPGVGSVTDTLLRDYILKNAGLNADSDVTMQSGMKPADMATSLYGTKEVDAIITWEPYVSQAIKQYGSDVKILFDSSAEIKKATQSDNFYPVNVLSVSSEFASNNSDLVKKFVDVYKNTVDYINQDSASDSDIAQILQLDSNVITDSRVRVDFNYKLDISGLNTTLQWAKDLGYLDAIPEKGEFYNESYIE